MAVTPDRSDRVSADSQGEDDDWKIVPSRPIRAGKERKADLRSGQPGARDGGMSGSKSGKGGGGYSRTRGERRSNEIRTTVGDHSIDNGTTDEQSFRTGHAGYRTRESRTPRQDNGRTSHELNGSLFADRKPEGGSVSDKVGKPIILHGIGPRGLPNPGRKHFRNDVSKGRGKFDSADERTGTELKLDAGDRSKLPRGLLRIRRGMETQLSPGSPESDRASREEDHNFSLASEDWPGVSDAPMKSTGEEGEGGGTPKWTAIVKTRPPKPPKTVPEEPGKPPTGDTSGSASEGEGGGEASRKKKKKKKKKGTGQPAVQQERHRDQPLMFELGSVFDALTTSPRQQQGKKPSKVVMGTGSIPVLARAQSEKVPSPANKAGASPRNILDSSAPVQKRGKEREVPKKKKPSNMRKVISREKEERKKLREQGLPIPPDLDVTKEVGSDVDSCSGDEVDPTRDETPPTSPHPPSLPSIHSRKFREYCSHLVSEDLSECVSTLLQELVRFQDRQYLRDPIRAHARRRYVCGMREVTKHLKVRKLKCVIIPPNLDKIQSTGGVTDAITQIVALCKEQAVPTVFALSRRRLAVILKKKHKIGCVGIFSYDGAELHYKKMMELVEAATDQYQSRTTTLLQNETGTALSTALLQSGDLEGAGLSGSLTQDSSSGSDMLDDMENGNGTQTVEQSPENQTSPQPKSILETPWRIFLPETSIADVSRTASSRTTSSNLGPHKPNPKTDLPSENGCHGDSAPRTVAASNGESTLNIGPPSSNIGPPSSNIEPPSSNIEPPSSNIEPPISNGSAAMFHAVTSASKFQFNIKATEFVPTFQFSLNVNAMEFTPNFSPSFQTSAKKS